MPRRVVVAGGRRMCKAARMTSATEPDVSAASAANARHQRAWYWYDFANSAYLTTTATVLLRHT